MFLGTTYQLTSGDLSGNLLYNYHFNYLYLHLFYFTNRLFFTLSKKLPFL